MNVMTVGNENLPNVFIEKIFVSPLSAGRKKITIKLTMFDHSPESGGFPRSWKRPELSDLQIKVLFASDQASTDLQLGQSSLFDYPAAAGAFVLSSNDFFLEEELEGYTKFSNQSIEIVTLESDVDVHVACYIDGLNFGNDLFNKFYGPMSSEKILVAGDINKQSGYFYYPETNMEYGGPVHQHPQTGYMEGSEHKEDPHKKLEYVVQENFKIQGTIDYELIPGDAGETEDLDGDQNNSSTSGASTTTDSDQNQMTSGGNNQNQTTQDQSNQVATSTPSSGGQQRGQSGGLAQNQSFTVRDTVSRSSY